MTGRVLWCTLLLVLASGCADSRPTQSAIAAEPGAGDWPRWRGPDGDGISRETDWKAKWSADGPPELWAQELGTGFSSVSVVGDRLYTMGRLDDEDAVWCLDTANGDVVWKHTYPCKLVDNLHEGGPACTPTVVGDRVYTVSKEGHLFCLDRHKGQVVWKHELQSLLDVNMPSWGFSCSPLPYRQWIVVEAGRTVAFDGETGDVAWQTEKYQPGYGSPALFVPAGEDLIATLNNEVLLVVRAADGSQVDKFPWVTNFATNSTSPVVWQDTIFVSTGYDRGCTLLKLVDGKLESLWENKELRNHMNNSVLWQGHLYGFDGNSHARRQVSLVCLDHASGKTAWRERGLGCGSLLISAGTIIAMGDEGELVTAPASSARFEPISRANVIEDKCWTVPVLAHGRIYCRNSEGHLVALDVR